MSKSPFDVRKLGGSGSPLSKRLSLMSSSTLNRKRLFSFRTTKKTWERRIEVDEDGEEEEDDEIPKEIAEADTDEELHATASGSETLDSSCSGEDTEGSDGEQREEIENKKKKKKKKKKKNNDNSNNESVVEEEKKRKEIEEKIQHELEEEKEKKENEMKKAASSFPNIKRAYLAKRSSGIMQTSRHLWEESGKRRATDDSATALKNKPEGEEQIDGDEGEGRRIETTMADVRKRHSKSSPALSIGVGGSRISGRVSSPVIGNASLKKGRRAKTETREEEEVDNKAT